MLPKEALHQIQWAPGEYDCHCHNIPAQHVSTCGRETSPTFSTMRSKRFVILECLHLLPTLWGVFHANPLCSLPHSQRQPLPARRPILQAQ